MGSVELAIVEQEGSIDIGSIVRARTGGRIQLSSTPPPSTMLQPLPAPKPPDNFAPYLQRDGDHLIAFFVDLNLQAVAPDPGLPLLLTATVRLHHPSDAGFPTDEEAQKLWDLEERLLEALQPMERIRYLGRTSSRGERTFAFQAAEPDGFIAAAQAVEKQLPAYPLKLSGKKDPGWKSYLNGLFPPPVEHQRCLSLERLRRIARAGRPARHRPRGRSLPRFPGGAASERRGRRRRATRLHGGSPPGRRRFGRTAPIPGGPTARRSTPSIPAASTK